MTAFLKDVKKIGFSNIAVILFGLINSIVVARVLGPEKNGILATLLVYPVLFISFGGLGISEAATYFLGRKILSKKKLMRSIAQIWVVTSLLCVLSCFLLIRYVSNSGEDLFLIFLALAPIPFSLFKDYFSGIFLAKGNFGLFNRIYWLPKLISCVLIVVFLLYFAMDLEGVLIALIVGPCLMFFLLLAKIKKGSLFRVSIKWKVIKRLLGLGFIYALTLLVIRLNFRLDIILLDYLSIPYEVGIYSKGMGIVEYLWQIPMIFSHVVMQRSAVAKDDRAFSLKVSQLLRLSFIIMGIAALAMFLLSDFLIIGMYGEAFSGSISVLKILLPGVVLLTIYKVMSTDLAGKGKPWVTLKAMALALPLNIILNYFLIPEYGAEGAAMASTISYSFAAFTFLNFYSKTVHIPVKTILKVKKTDFEPIKELLLKVTK